MTDSKKDPVIVVLQLTGGNDYMNTVVPYSNSQYWDYRPNVNIKEDEVIRLNNQIGFHPSMEPIAEMYRKGNVRPRSCNRACSDHSGAGYCKCGNEFHAQSQTPRYSNVRFCAHNGLHLAYETVRTGEAVSHEL